MRCRPTGIASITDNSDLLPFLNPAISRYTLWNAVRSQVCIASFNPSAVINNDEPARISSRITSECHCAGTVRIDRRDVKLTGYI